jgi:hypothetical protein
MPIPVNESQLLPSEVAPTVVEPDGILVPEQIEQEPVPFLIPLGNNDYELHVDNTSKELFETCARAAEYYSVYRREGVGERAALFRGSVIHEALGIRKRSNFLNPNFEKEQIAHIITRYLDKDFGPDEWRTAEHAVDTIILYNKQWPIASEPYTLLQGTTELPFKILLGKAELNSEITTHAGTFHVRNVYIYWTGIIDAIVNYGQTLVMDHKTTSILGPQFFDDFVLSSQMNGYVWSARKLGYPAVGLLLDAIAGRKPTKTGVAHEYQRNRYYYEEQHLAEWEKDTFTLITDFLEHLCRGYFPKSPKWCFGKFGRCQYWDICSSIPDRRMGLIQSDLYKPVTWSALTPTL